MKTAVVLFNLGGPDSPRAIRPFLFRFFTDPNIIRLPALFRWMLATWIALRRSKKEAAASYALIGGKSPLLENTQAQADALEKLLGDNYRVFVCMRYWHPMARETAAQVKEFAPDNIVLLPLYPQYSTTTTRSSMRTWRRVADKIGIEAPSALVCCYPTDPAFIAASAKLVRAGYDAAQAEARAQGLPDPRILFSAHGLPESIVRDGDPYAWQCEQTALAILDRLGLPEIDWVLCYQSRVGRQKWLAPDTADELRRAGAERVPVVIYPLAFTQEHVETLAEIEIEYRHLAKTMGVPLFRRVATVGTDGDFIAGLAAIVKDAQGRSGILSQQGGRFCSRSLRHCACQNL